MTPAGIEPATFRFVAQHLNHCDTAVRHLLEVLRRNTSILNQVHLLNQVPKQDILNTNLRIININKSVPMKINLIILLK